MVPYRVTLPRFTTARLTTRRAMLWMSLAAAAAAVWRSFRRVEVVGTSMAPALLPGDRLVVMGRPWLRQPWPVPGAVIAVRDPRLPDRILIKRVAELHRRTGTLDVVGDSPRASTDSRTFGSVPRSSIVGRAIYRYAPPGRSGPAPWPAEYDQA